METVGVAQPGETLEHLPVPKGATSELKRGFGQESGVAGQGGTDSN